MSRDDSNTIRVRACQFLGMSPWSTATQVAKALRSMKPLRRVTTASVASCLHRLTEEGLLVRKSGCGPRGGMGYKIAEVLTWHDRLLGDDL